MARNFIRRDILGAAAGTAVCLPAAACAAASGGAKKSTLAAAAPKGGPGKAKSGEPKSSGFHSASLVTSFAMSSTLAPNGSVVAVGFDDFILACDPGEQKAGVFHGRYAFALQEPNKASSFAAVLKAFESIPQGGAAVLTFSVGSATSTVVLGSGKDASGADGRNFDVEVSGSLPEPKKAAYLPVSVMVNVTGGFDSSTLVHIDTFDIALEFAKETAAK